MNERIKKIAKDAGVLGDWGEDVLEGRFFITGNTKQMEKFAELIVREYGNIVLHYTDVDEGVRVANKHFGVEE